MYLTSITLNKTKRDVVSYVTFPVLNLKEEQRYTCVYVYVQLPSLLNLLCRDLIIMLKMNTACGTTLNI